MEKMNSKLKEKRKKKKADKLIKVPRDKLAE